MLEYAHREEGVTPMAYCNTCYRHCHLEEGMQGACRARICRDGAVTASVYGEITAISLDPIEKKPLARFCPGSKVLSVGFLGCNFNCPFCQNYDISYAGKDKCLEIPDTTYISPERLTEMALGLMDRGNIGLAFTYNEPLTSWEYVRDAGRMSHEAGMKNVLVSNGSASAEVLEEVLPYIDAMNIDLKTFDPDIYSGVLGGSLESVKAFIGRACTDCHMEITTLVVPGISDSEDMIRDMASWIASLPGGKDITYHLTRFFPRYKMDDVKATNVELIYHLADVAGEYLDHVYTGNC